MKRYLGVFVLLMILRTGFAQHTADFGIWGGIESYAGDMTEVNYKSSLAPAFGAFLRYNLTSRYALRAFLMSGKMKASGEFESHIWSFSKPLTDLSLMGEFNFFKYSTGNKQYSLTPYLMAGFGVSTFSYEYDPVRLKGVVAYFASSSTVPAGYNIAYDENVWSMNIPVGFGFKFNVGKRWCCGTEAIIRKHFNDKIDNLDDPRKFYTDTSAAGNGTSGYWTGYNDIFHNNDWTFHIGVHLSYQIFREGEKCAAYENIN